MKIWTRRREFTTIALGAYLSFSPWIFGMSWDAWSSANAAIVGVLLVEAALWSILVAGSRVAGRAKVALGVWLLAAPLVLGLADLAATLSAWIVGSLVLVSADTAKVASDVATSWRAHNLRYRMHTITPESIAQFGGQERSVGAERLARQIVESSHQIRQTLLDKPSELEVEACTLGYNSCAENMITLVQLVDEELVRARFFRRLKLKAALRRATDSLSLAREALPQEALRTRRRKRLC